MTAFTLSPYNLEQIGREGSGRVTLKVAGYWSGDSATLYINRKTQYSSSLSHLPFSEHPHAWEVTSSHASGGRDTKEVESDIQALQNFGVGLTYLAQVGFQILEQAEQLEQYYQAEKAIELAARQQEQAAHLAAVEADAALGHEIAETYMKHAKAHAVAKGQEAVIHAYHRGQDSFNKVVVTCSRSGSTRVVFNGVLVPFKQAVSMLAERSHRSAFVTE